MKRVLFRPAAVKELERLEGGDRDLVEAAIERFATTGQGDVKMLQGAERHLAAEKSVTQWWDAHRSEVEDRLPGAMRAGTVQKNTPACLAGEGRGSKNITG